MENTFPLKVLDCIEQLAEDSSPFRFVHGVVVMESEELKQVRALRWSFCDKYMMAIKVMMFKKLDDVGVVKLTLKVHFSWDGLVWTNLQR